MSKFRLFQIVVLFAVTACFVCGQQAQAQAKRHGLAAAPKTHTQVVRNNTNPPPPKGFYPMGQAFSAYYPTLDSNGNDYWPCETGIPNYANGDPSDCSGIYSGGVVVGVPQYIWSLATPGALDQPYGCDGNTNGTNSSTYIPCGQILSWFEDDTDDLTDDIVYSVTVTQAGGIIYDSGTEDYGINTPPNGYGGLTPPYNDVVSWDDANFGALGQTGPNNGNCSADTNYPGIGGPSSGYFVIQANKTCVDAAPGLATITGTIALETPAWTCKVVKGVDTCTVKYTKKYSLTQKWTIWLQ